MKKVTLFTLALTAGLSAWGQTFSGGTGTEADPYKIAKAEDFTELANEVNEKANSFTGKYFALQNDITFASSFSYPTIGKWVSFREQNKFDGVFDGKNHTLTNLVLTSKDGERYGGLFGIVDTAGVVKNINLVNPRVTVDAGTSLSGGTVVGQLAGTVDNVHVTGGSYNATISGFKGGLVGNLVGGGYVLNSSYSGSMSCVNTFAAIVGQNYGVVRNCWSDATLTAQLESQTFTGGIVGVALGSMAGEGKPQVEISDCYYFGTLSSANGNCGGILGNGQQVVVERCWNAGYIQSGNYTGGLAGQLTDATVKDCYNSGTVYNQSTSAVGGLVGYLSGTAAKTTIENCLSFGTIFNSIIARTEGCEYVGQNVAGVTPKNCYFDSQVAGWGGTLGAKTTKELTSGTAIDGFDAGVWQFAGGMYPRLKKTADTDIALLNATPFFLADGETHGKVTKNFTVSNLNDVEWDVTGTTQARLSGNTVTVTRGSKLSNAVLHAYLGDYEKRCLVSIYPQIFEGTGTETDPYIIANYDDMKKLSDATNSQGMTFDGEYFKVTGDIDMQNDATFPIISDAQSVAFSGIFDGQGHSIKNWKFNNVNTTDLWSALFSFVAKDGVIKNLVIDKSCSLRFHRNAGSLVAALFGTVENCKNYAEVYTAEGFAGGLVYIAYSGSKILNSYNEGAVTSLDKGYIGGVAYNVEAGATISGCQNAGTVSSGGATTQSVGGLVGSCAGTVENSLNTGNVSGVTNVGGIAGSAKAAKFENVLSTGAVSFTGDDATAGAVIGKYESACTFSNVVYDKQIAVYKNIEAAGLEGKLTSELVSTAFGGDLWTSATGLYPQLKQFKDETGAKLGAYPVTFDAADTRTQVSKDATLAAADGLVWAVEKGTDFTISGNTLKYNESDKAANDNLTATYGGLTKLIPLAAIGKILPGDGTAENPYIIATPADLVKVSSTVASTKNGFGGKVFAITADLDMKDAEFEPIGSKSTAKFNATLDGKDHAISNLTINKPNDEYVGLVGVLGLDGQIKNLTIKSGAVTGKNFVGAVVGEAEGSLTNVTNYATVTASAKAGGIAGHVAGATSTYTGLENHGNVSATGSSGYAGGIAALASASNLSSAKNYGAVKSDKSVAGGIVGYVEHGGTLDKTANYGDVNAYGPGAGVVGQNTISYSDAKTVRFEVNNSVNAGNVTTTYNAAGGIVGDIDSEAGQTFVNNVANTGAVVNTKASITKTAAGAAGIVGKGNPEITNAYNSGTISANNGVAGIMGMPGSSYSKFKVANSVSTGSIVGYAGDSENVGAIAVKASKYLTLENVAYDSQMCIAKAVGKADAEGVSALSTYDLVYAYTPGEGWTSANAAGHAFDTDARYPYPTSIGADSAVAVAVVPLYLEEGDTKYEVTKTFRVGLSDNLKWSIPENFTVSGYYVAAKPNTVGEYKFTVNYGSFARTYTLYVNAPEGTGVDNVIKADDAISAVAGGVVLPEGNYAVYTVAGALVKSGVAVAGETVELPQGIYVVKAVGAAAKILVK